MGSRSDIFPGYVRKLVRLYGPGWLESRALKAISGTALFTPSQLEALFSEPGEESLLHALQGLQKSPLCNPFVGLSPLQKLVIYAGGFVSESAIRNPEAFLTKRSDVLKALSNFPQAPDDFSQISQVKLEELFVPCGMTRKRAAKFRLLVEALLAIDTNLLVDDVSSLNGAWLAEELASVRGIGSDTADSLLLWVFRQPHFALNAPLVRLLHYHNFVPEDTYAEELKACFTDYLPADQATYAGIYRLGIELGAELCKKSTRQCGMCPLEAYLP